MGTLSGQDRWERAMHNRDDQTLFLDWLDGKSLCQWEPFSVRRELRRPVNNSI